MMRRLCRYNARILAPVEGDAWAPRQVKLGRSFIEALGEHGSHPLGYLHGESWSEEVQGTTHWVVCDVGTQVGMTETDQKRDRQKRTLHSTARFSTGHGAGDQACALISSSFQAGGSQKNRLEGRRGGATEKLQGFL